MKNSIKQLSWAMVLLFVIASCAPQEMDNHSLNELYTISNDQVTFSKTVSTKSQNVITFTNTSTLADNEYVVMWDLGNGVTKTGKVGSITGEYPFKGDYTVTLTIMNNNSSATRSEVVHIANDDYSLISTHVYVNLTGGAEDTDGKVWVFDQYNNFSAEVAAALAPLKAEYPEPERAAAYNIKGHMGLGPQGSRGQEWWGAGPNEKNTWTMYDFKFTFVQQGVKLKIENKQQGYGRAASSATVGGFSVTSTSGEDAVFTYGGGNYNFSIDESGKYPKLALTGNAFMGYYCGSQEYEIIYQTDKVMALRVNNQVESQDWVFVYCLEELNVAVPPVVKEPKAVPLAENFETSPLKVNFVAQDMGDRSGVVDNPLPLPINTSNKVYRYQKSNAFYSNLSWVAADYKFDLTTQNKIKVKVFIPSYNDYTTENKVAGDWISNTKLQPQLAVKLQNSEHPEPWVTQTEIVKANLAKDKWIELTFDFSGVADRKDYDKIVIQFGAEGHAGPGFFFFDDFSFDK